jgi:lipoyl(octanoyl) transferase
LSRLVIKHLGQLDYEPAWRAMQDFTAARNEDTPDELWVLEHPPVFTLGQAGKREHLLRPTDIPVVSIDRGGQITYHGPGQVVVYVLVDLKRRGYGVKELVHRMEQAVIELLSAAGIEAERQTGAPGVYVAGAKIAALGLRIKQGRSYHGLALNVDMDLSPFALINPCGYPGMSVTQTRDLGMPESASSVGEMLARRLAGKIAA